MTQQATLPSAATHEFRTLHFDLGHIRYGGPLELIAAGRKVALERHTEESIAQLRSTLHPSVAAKAKLERLTHVAREVPLRRNDIKLLHVRAVRPTGTETPGSAVPLGILAAGLHIPASIRPRCIHSARKRSHFGLGAEDDSSFLQDLFTTDDTATVVIFLHPDSVNFDPGTFEQVYNTITASGAVAYLDNSIRQQGDDWVTSQPVTNMDGTQWYDANGNPGFMSLYSTQTASDALMPMQIVVQSLKDNLQLQGHNWTAIQGLACISSGPASLSSMGTVRARAVGDAAPVWAIQNQSPAGGLTLGNLTAGTQDGFTTLQIGFDNLYSRHLSVYVEYLDANGNVIDLSNLTFPTPTDPSQDQRFRKFDTGTARLLDVLQPQAYFSGIPLTFISNNYTVTVPIPADSVGGIASVNMLCGGMGSGAWTYPSNIEMIGTVLTAVFEYGFPVILAAVDMGVDNSILSGWFSSNTADLLVDEGLLTLATQLPITEWGPNNWQAFLIPVIQYIVTYIIPTYGPMLFATVPEVTAEASDPVGWIAAAVSITMTVLSLASTTSDVLQSPPVYANTLSYSMTISITLLPDINDPTFPEVATNYTVIARFTNGTTVQRFDGNVAPNTKTLDPVVFNNVPAGGTMTVQVIFFSSDGWIAGQALWQGQCALQNGQPEMDLTIQITENLVQLTSSTVYSHASILEYESGSHAWVASPPPQDVASALTIHPTPPYCSQLQSLTYAVESVSPTASEGLLGYTWQATSDKIAQCGQTSDGAAVYLSQVLSSANPPDTALVFSGCGIAEPASLAFDLSNPSDNGFFYIDPRNGSVFVRRFDQTQPPYTQNSLSCGSLFPELSVDDLAIFQAKFLVAINTDLSKLQIVHLSETDGPDSAAPAASMLSGYGTRAGLMNSPVAVAVAKDGTILVLENGNSRLQAFDEYGGPLMGYFAGSPFMTLQNIAAGQLFIDLAIESTGYIYILSQLPPVNDDLVYTDYVLDVYTPAGAFLCRSAGIAAAKMDVDHWRNVWALNYHLLISPSGAAEPSISLWTPSGA